MRVSVTYHGIVRDMVRPKVESIDVPDGATVGDLISQLHASSERNAVVLKQTQTFIDGHLVERSTPLIEGAQITFMRPIAGG